MKDDKTYQERWKSKLSLVKIWKRNAWIFKRCFKEKNAGQCLQSLQVGETSEGAVFNTGYLISAQISVNIQTEGNIDIYRLIDKLTGWLKVDVDGMTDEGDGVRNPDDEA